MNDVEAVANLEQIMSHDDNDLSPNDKLALQHAISAVNSLSRVKALPVEWREYASSLRLNHDNAVISRVRKGCADELDAAIEGDE